MSQSRQLEKLLNQAEEYEKGYEWLQAVKRYKKALKGILDEKDYLRGGEVWERIGYCLDRAAFQADTQEKFRDRMKQAVEA